MQTQTTRLPTAAITGDLPALFRSRLSANEYVYVIADAARDHDLAISARDAFGLRIRSLFGVKSPQFMERVAPYLVTVGALSDSNRRGLNYLNRWSERLGSSAGILLTTQAAPETLWAQLDKLFRVTDDHGLKYYFRFYDPRVLRSYLPACVGKDVAEFFGPIRRLVVEAEARPAVFFAEPADSGVRMSEYSVQRADRQAAPRPKAA